VYAKGAHNSTFPAFPQPIMGQKMVAFGTIAIIIYTNQQVDSMVSMPDQVLATNPA
jgi:hypothetical protein